MSSPDDSHPDVFGPGGNLRTDLLTGSAASALDQAVEMARNTRWDSIRSPHIFLGLLATPTTCVCDWGRRLQADLPDLENKFRELFYQDQGDTECPLKLHREFLSDNVIRLLRLAYARTREHGRERMTPMDLLITLLSSDNSIVAQCFTRIGIPATTLTDLALQAEQSCACEDEDDTSLGP